MGYIDCRKGRKNVIGFIKRHFWFSLCVFVTAFIVTAFLVAKIAVGSQALQLRWWIYHAAFRTIEITIVLCAVMVFKGRTYYGGFQNTGPIFAAIFALLFLELIHIDMTEKSSIYMGIPAIVCKADYGFEWAEWIYEYKNAFVMDELLFEHLYT